MSMTDFPDVEDVADTAPEDEAELSIEDRARLRGWKPESEYHGPPGRWRSAEEFMRVGENDRAVLFEENRRLETKLNRVSRKFDQQTQTIEELRAGVEAMKNLAQRADERGYGRALSELKDKRTAAVEIGDRQTFDQIDQQIDVLQAERAKVTAPPEPVAPKPKIAPEILEFVEANPWYNSDQTLNRSMQAFFQAVEIKHPGYSLDEKLETAKARVVAEFPEKFGRQTPRQPEFTDEDMPDQPRRRTAAVARPQSGAVRRPSQATGWEAIEDAGERKIAQDAYERIKRADPNITVAEYVAIYQDPHADVIALRKQRQA